MFMLHLLQYDRLTRSDTTEAAEARDSEKKRDREKLDTMWDKENSENSEITYFASRRTRSRRRLKLAAYCPDNVQVPQTF